MQPSLPSDSTACCDLHPNACCPRPRPRLRLSTLCWRVPLRSTSTAPTPAPLDPQIGDRGAKALARVLDANSVVAALDLTDNSIHEGERGQCIEGVGACAGDLQPGCVCTLSCVHTNDSHASLEEEAPPPVKPSAPATPPPHAHLQYTEGGRALGRALLSSRALATLTLRLNRLGAGGCAALCEALAFAGSGGSAVTSGNGSIASSITSGGGHGSSGNGSHTVRGDGGSGAVRGAPLEVLSLAANSAGPGCVASLVAMLRMARCVLVCIVLSV